MKFQNMAIFVLYYGAHLQAHQNTTPQTISIKIDASTKSDLAQVNSLKQQAEHQSVQATTVTTPIQEPILRRYQPHELQAVNSMSSSVIKKTTALCAIGAMAAATNPWILPAYAAWRAGCYFLGDEPIIDSATEQEAQELAEKGKKRVSELVFFPKLYALFRPSGK